METLMWTLVIELLIVKCFCIYVYYLCIFGPYYPCECIYMWIIVQKIHTEKIKDLLFSSQLT